MKRATLRRRMMGLVLIVSLMFVAAPVALAADFPSKPITVLVSSSAGSPADLMAREVAHFAGKYIGQPMVVVNKTGGSGGVMFAALKTAPTDGYTIAAGTAGQFAAMHSQLKKDFRIDEFDFLYNVQVDPYALAVTADSPFKTLKDMIDFAKKNPDKGRLQMGGQGTGSSLHLICLQLAEEAGFKFTWLPYKGGSESVKNLLGGHVAVVSTAPATVSQYVEAGKIRVLAITGDKRLGHMKDVPTFKELGYDIELTQYRGIIAKKGLPADVKAKIVEAVKKGVQDPGFKAFMAKAHQADGSMAPEVFTAYAKKNFALVGKLMQMIK